jgi:hypothetical protein
MLITALLLYIVAMPIAVHAEQGTAVPQMGVSSPEQRADYDQAKLDARADRVTA